MMLILLTMGCANDAIEACEGFDAAQPVGSVSIDALTEASGLVASAQHPGVLWTHNDSGDTARLFAIDESGAAVGSLTLAGAIPEDWEDIARSGNTLYVGDIGDNDQSRAAIAIWEVPEPTTLDGDGSAGARRISLSYPDGAHDAEALIHHDGSLWVITKDADGAAVYRASDPSADSQALSLETVLLLPDAAGSLPEVTAADTSPDGSSLFIRTEAAVLVYNLARGLPEALSGTPCVAPAPDADDGESIAATGRGYAALSEGANPTLWLAESS
ncbi:MAG: hypothetical protein VX265_00120 [Myxococcota bacterium]|nr:hypothetical protein [Myxococcota bacterium]